MKLHSVLMVLVQSSIVFVKVLGHFLSDHLDIKFSLGYIRCKDTIKHWFLYFSSWIINEFLKLSYKRPPSIVLTCSLLRSGKQPAL